MPNIVRVLRIIEYVGEREWVEKTVANSVRFKHVGKGFIQGATLSAYPEILDINASGDNSDD